MAEPIHITIPESAVAELEMVEQMDWEDGIGLNELIDWINQVVARFRPESIDEHSRSSGSFTSRSFRHYQTLGCIDPPERRGKKVVYRFNHYLQGLLVRKLLWERMASSQMAAAMQNQSIEDLKKLLLDGIAIVPLHGSGGGTRKTVSPASEPWRRFHLADGVEIHISEKRVGSAPVDSEAIIQRVREILNG